MCFTVTTMMITMMNTIHKWHFEILTLKMMPMNIITVMKLINGDDDDGDKNDDNGDDDNDDGDYNNI